MLLHTLLSAAALTFPSEAGEARPAATAGPSPRLIVLVAVDQMIPEQFERLGEHMDGGLGRLGTTMPYVFAPETTAAALARLAYETPMALVNRHLASVETVFLLPDPAHALVSSSLVRQVASLGGDVSPYVPPAVARFLDTGARDI